MQSYNINPKTHGVNGYGVTAPDNVWRVKFDGTTVASVTVVGDLPMGSVGAVGRPTPDPISSKNPAAHNRYIAHFAYGGKVPSDIYVGLNTTVTAPSTNNFVKGSGELFPKAWEVKQGDVIYALGITADSSMSVWFEHITN
jgi:hypothetical protein